MPRPVIGLTIGARELVAIRLGPSGGAPSYFACPVSDADEIWGTVQAWLAALDPANGRRRPALAVALLPPLVQLRRIDLPRLRPAELERVLERDAARYFLGAQVPQLLGILRAESGTRASAPVIAAAAPAWLVRRVTRLATELGWELRQVVPAHVVWSRSGPASQAARRIVVIGEQSVEILRVRGSRPWSARRTPPRVEAVIAALREADGDEVHMLDANDGWQAALAEAGIPLRRSAEPAAELAARGAPATTACELVTTEARTGRDRWARRTARRLWTAAALLLLTSAGLVRLDLARELAGVRHARAQHQTAVVAAMRERDSLAFLEARMTALAAAERSAPRWTAVFALLADRLPRDAWLGSLEGTPDSLQVEGTADRAGGVFEALQRAPGVRAVRATAPIRQVNDGDDVPMERFSLLAELRVPGDTTR